MAVNVKNEKGKFGFQNFNGSISPFSSLASIYIYVCCMYNIYLHLHSLNPLHLNHHLHSLNHLHNFFGSMGERCNCNKWVVVRTAWTDTNSGWRFAGCPDFGCNYFRWVDGPLCERARIIIPELIRRINALEGEIKALEVKNQKKSSCSKSMLLLLITWFMICVFLMAKKNEEEI